MQYIILIKKLTIKSLKIEKCKMRTKGNGKFKKRDLNNKQGK